MVGDEALWLAMLNDRNLTSHTYHEELAKKIYSHIASYHEEMSRLHAFLTKRFN